MEALRANVSDNYPMIRSPLSLSNIARPALNGFELTSPKMRMSNAWEERLNLCLSKPPCLPSEACGMHIHVSSPEPLTLGQLSSLAESIFWLVGAFLGLIPPSRREFKYIKGIRRNIALAAGLDAVKASIEQIDRGFRATRTRNTRKTVQALVDWIQPT